MHEHHDDDHDHSPGHEPHAAHGHGNAHDQGWRAAARYLRMFPRMWRSPVSDAVVAEVAPRAGELVVDLAAGMGPATARAAATGAQVLAVDPTPTMRRVLAVRRRLLPRRQRSLVSVHDGAAESLPIATGCVDALWCINAMHHWTDRPAALAELARVMRPGGRILLVDEDFADPAHPSHEAHQQRHSHRHLFDDVDVDDMADGLRQAGFTVDEAARRPVADRPALVLRARRD